MRMNLACMDWVGSTYTYILFSKESQILPMLFRMKMWRDLSQVNVLFQMLEGQTDALHLKC